MKVAFFVRHFTERGTEVAIYDYAKYNEELLHNQSLIVCFTQDQQAHHTGLPDRTSLAKFAQRFPIHEVTHFDRVQELVVREQVDVLYTLTHGGSEEFYQWETWPCTTVFHCVFDTRCPHGDIHCCISPTLNREYGTDVPVLPHIVALPDVQDDLREVLGIPTDAWVFGRHGGYLTFDLPYVQETVVEVAQQFPDIYFVFVNTLPFLPSLPSLPSCLHLPNLFFLDTIVDDVLKTRFINTCDAMIHARSEGETFGLAVAEFALRGKTILTAGGASRAHLDILQDQAVVFDSKETLFHLLTHPFRKDMSVNAYQEFSPERVMARFQSLLTRTAP